LKNDVHGRDIRQAVSHVPQKIVPVRAAGCVGQDRLPNNPSAQCKKQGANEEFNHEMSNDRGHKSVHTAMPLGFRPRAGFVNGVVNANISAMLWADNARSKTAVVSP
jgi:hypothetical protein